MRTHKLRFLANHTHIIGYFGIVLLAIDGEVKVPGALNCSSMNLAENTTVYNRGEIKNRTDF